MADNVEITAGAGTDIATDDVASVHYQKIKLALGADGAVDCLLDSGQQTMANSAPVAIASDQSTLGVTQANASNTYGSQENVAAGNTVTLVTYSAGASWRLVGFVAGGEADGRFFVQIDGVTKYVLRTNIAQRQARLVLPFPDAAAGGGKTVTLCVENTGAATANYEGTLLGV